MCSSAFACSTADEALASNDIAATWMRENVLEFVKGMPEAMAGNVAATPLGWRDRRLDQLTLRVGEVARIPQLVTVGVGHPGAYKIAQ